MVSYSSVCVCPALPPFTPHLRPLPSPLTTMSCPVAAVSPPHPLQKVRWSKWLIRIGFNAREGLVLHNVGYEDGGRLRPVLHRASLAEMAVPYGQPE